MPTVEDIENALIDFGFYHTFPEVARMYAQLINSNYVSLGYSGGVNEQPEEYWHDMATMRWLSLWVTHAKNVVRLKQDSVFDNMRDNGQMSGAWLNGDN